MRSINRMIKNCQRINVFDQSIRFAYFSLIPISTLFGWPSKCLNCAFDQFRHCDGSPASPSTNVRFVHAAKSFESHRREWFCSYTSKWSPASLNHCILLVSEKFDWWWFDILWSFLSMVFGDLMIILCFMIFNMMEMLYKFWKII